MSRQSRKIRNPIASSKKLSKVWHQNAEAWDKMPVRNMHVDVNLITCIKKGLCGSLTGKKLLYIGFGEGQNLVFLAKEGVNCHGTELAESRIANTRKLLEEQGLKASLYLVDSTKLPFPDDYFDHVIAWQSLYYNDESGFKDMLGEIHRVMKTGGHFLSAHLSIKHSMCARKITSNTYSPDLETQKQCILFPLKNRDHAKRLFSRFFNRILIGYWTISLMDKFDQHYIIHCRKGSVGDHAEHG